MSKQLACSVILLLTLSAAVTSSDLSVTGLIEIPAESTENFQWSAIEIVLMTKEGKIIGRANPTNHGFYLMPVYQKKDQELVVRSNNANFNFEPNNYSLALNGLSSDSIEDQFNRKSYNFKLAGIMSKGKVFIKGTPKNAVYGEPVTVNIFQGEKLINTTETNAKGFYEFKNVDLGKYRIQASHSKLKFQVSSVSCELSFEHGQTCDQDLLVFGRGFSGRLVNSEYGLENVKVSLVASSGQKSDVLEYCQNKEGDSCVTVTDHKGQFRFEDLPLGVYTVLLKGNSDGAVVYTSSQSQVTHSQTSSESSEITVDASAPSLTGQIVNTNQNGIPNVTIYVDGEKKTTTDKSGNFEISNVSFGNFLLEAQHQHYFIKASNFTVNSRSTRDNVIGTVTANYVSLCGKIDFANENIALSRKYVVKIHLESVADKQKRATVFNEETNTYCFEVTDGQYLVKPTITVDGTLLAVVPPERKVTIKGVPFLEANFSREKLAIKGNVEWLAGADKKTVDSTTVFLYNSKNTLVAEWLFKGKQEKSKFEFGNLFNEDHYTLKVKNDKFCFGEDEIFFDTKNPEAPIFLQTGVKVSYSSDVSFRATVEGSKVGEQVDLEKGDGHFCLRSQTQVTLATDECYKFKGDKAKVTVNPVSSEKLEFRVEKVLVQGSVISDVKGISKKLKIDAAKIMGMLQNDVKINVESEKGKHLSASKLEHVGEFNGKQKFLYKFYLAAEKKYKFVKQISESKTPNFISKLIIFPESIEYMVFDMCVREDRDLDFEASLGLMITGKINKNIENYKLVLKKLVRDQSDIPESDRKYTKVRTYNQTGQSFSIGPFPNSEDYQVELIKEDYEFLVNKKYDEAGNLNFTISSLEISSLVINVKNQSNEKPLSGVSLYITSTDKNNYQKYHLQTSKDGVVKRNLLMGKYFVKAVLKEYSFEPDQQIVDLGEGQKLKINLKARRIEYSILGKVKIFGMQGTTELDVEATSEDVDNHGDKHSESSLIGKESEFLIKGLKPGKTYNVSVPSLGGFISIPESHRIVMGKSDKLNVDFILAEKWKVLSLSGVVKFSDKWTDSERANAYPLRVTIQNTAQPMTASSIDQVGELFSEEQRMSNLSLFEFVNLKSGVYDLTVYANDSTNPMSTKSVDLTAANPGVFDMGEFLIEKDATILGERNSDFSIGPVLILVAFIYVIAKERIDAIVSSYLKK